MQKPWICAMMGFGLFQNTSHHAEALNPFPFMKPSRTCTASRAGRAPSSPPPLMSNPALKARPAAFSTIARTSLSPQPASSRASRTSSWRSCESALIFSGRFSVTVAIGPSTS